jgi:transcriptional regulator with XRE-family HTH domain
MMHVGKTARYVRERKGLTLRAAAGLLEISHVHLCNIENNRAVASLQLLEKMKDVYGVDLLVLGWCLYGDVNRLPPAVRAPMKALGEAWLEELGAVATPPPGGEEESAC